MTRKVPFGFKASGTLVIAALLFGLSLPAKVVAQNFWQPTTLPANLYSAVGVSGWGEVFAANSAANLFRSTDDGVTWTLSGSLGAVVWDLAFDSTAIFAASAGAGVYRSTDDGATWQEVNSGLSRLIVWSVAVSPITGSVFAGTDSGGVFRSTDAGDTWMRTDVGFGSADVFALALNSSGDILAGTTGDGIYRSQDNGTSWTTINNGLISRDVRALAFNSSDEVFAGTFTGNVFRSTDTGENWTSADGGLSLGIVWSLAINSSDEIFAGGFSGGVYLSTDDGSSWTEINSGLPTVDVASLGINSFSGRIFAGTNGDGLFRSVEPIADNSPPQLIQSIPDTASSADGPIVIIALNDFFADPDQDSLFFFANSSNSGAVTAEVLAGDLLQLVPRSAGTSVITVIANDFISGEDSASFAITINPPLQLPGTTKVYWTDLSSRTILRANSDGTELENLVSDFTNAPLSLALDVTAGKMYWTESFDDGQPKIMRANLDGTSPDTLLAISGLVILPGITLDLENHHVYWSEIATAGQSAPAARQSGLIRRANLDGSRDTTVIADLFDPGGIAVGSGKLYWFDGSTGYIGQANLDGSGRNDIFLEQPATFPAIAFALNVPENRLYWYTDNTIRAANINDPIITDVVLNTGAISVLAMDADHGKIYWVEEILNDNAAVFRGNLDGTNLESLSLPVGLASYGIGVDGSNRPPQLRAGAVPDTTLVIGDDFIEVLQLDLNAIFVDPDGDPLRYFASAGDSAILSIDIDANEILSAVPVGVAGQTNVTITASEVRGGSLTVSFNVTVVVSGNRAPIVLNEIPDVTLVSSDPNSRLVVDLKNVFYDAEEDDLLFTAASSNESIATVDVAANVLTVTPQDSGQTQVTVIADDRNGGAAADSFMVTTVTSNAAPVLVRSLPDTFLVLNAPKVKLLLLPFFVDPDGDGLIYSTRSQNLSSGNRPVAVVEVVRDTLVMTANDTGAARVTVTGNDGKGGLTSTTFRADVYASTPPQITTVKLTPMLPVPGQSITVQATLVDADDGPGGITEVRLHYAAAGPGPAVPPLTMTTTIDGDTLRATGEIPSAAVTDRGVEYFVTGVDNKGVVGRRPFNGVASIAVQVNGLTHALQAFGSEQNGYRLISVPLALAERSPSTVLGDDLGPYDRKQWRFYDYSIDPASGNLIKVELNDTMRMNPGRAFWLIVRERGRSFNTGAGTTVATGQPYAISLRKGWSLVGTPFNFPAFAEAAALAGSQVSFYERGETWGDPFDPASRQLQPFEGYAVFCDTNCVVKFNPQTAAALPLTLPRLAETPHWAIRIKAHAQNAADHNNLVGVATTAARAWDRWDHPEPPGIGEYVSVYFPHPEWRRTSQQFTTDFRAEFQRSEEWDFAVASTILDEVRLTFEGIDQIPPNFEVWLVDKSLEVTRNLRQHNGYSVAGRGLEHPKSLTLVVSEAAALEEDYAQYRALPTSYELLQNFPNPFNPATTIQFGLPVVSRVTLRVFDLLGQEVVTLLDGELREPGYHLAVWNGRNASGALVGSGVYFAQLRTGDSVRTIKMLLVE